MKSKAMSVAAIAMTVSKLPLVFQVGSHAERSYGLDKQRGSQTIKIDKAPAQHLLPAHVCLV